MGETMNKNLIVGLAVMGILIAMGINAYTTVSDKFLENNMVNITVDTFYGDTFNKSFASNYYPTANYTVYMQQTGIEAYANYTDDSGEYVAAKIMRDCYVEDTTRKGFSGYCLYHVKYMFDQIDPTTYNSVRDARIEIESQIGTPVKMLGNVMKSRYSIIGTT
jgi:hypothetical protein